MKLRILCKTKTVYFVVLLIVSVLLEVFLFNCSFWKSHFNKPVEISESSIMMYDQDSLRLPSDLREYTMGTFAIPIDVEVESIALDFISDNIPLSIEFSTPHTITEKQTIETSILPVVVYTEDSSGNMLSYTESYVEVNSHGVCSIQLNGKGKTAWIYVAVIQTGYVKQISPVIFNSAIINPQIPFQFSYIRWLGVSAFLFFLYLFMPNSDLWNYSYFKITWIRYVLVGCILSLFIFWGTRNSIWWNENGFVDSYGELTKSLTKGMVSVDCEVDPQLCGMDNPYDYLERENLGVEYLFDYAFYDGKYYVYFGILPAIIFLPYYLITGEMPMYSLVFNAILGLYLLGLANCLDIYRRRYDQCMSVAEYILFYFLWVILSYIPLLYFNGYNYIFPQVLGATLFVWGIYFYLKAGVEYEKRISYIIIGSFCIALMAGCRPQQVLIAFIAFPLLKERMCKKGTAREWISFFLPYVVVAIPLMVYNKMRFGSVFDFGAYYNLTCGNIYNQRLSIDSLIGALKYYLFSLMEYMKDFPFINVHNLNMQVRDVSITESTGGYFATFPITLMPVLCWKYQKDTKKKELAMMQCILVILSFVMICVATFYYAQRYIFDFAPFMGLATVISSSLMLKNRKYTRLVRTLLVGAVICGFAYLFLFGFTKNLNTMNIYYTNPDYWYKVSRLVQFWK